MTQRQSDPMPNSLVVAGLVAWTWAIASFFVSPGILACPSGTPIFLDHGNESSPRIPRMLWNAETSTGIFNGTFWEDFFCGILPYFAGLARH